MDNTIQKILGHLDKAIKSVHQMNDLMIDANTKEFRSDSWNRYMGSIIADHLSKLRTEIWYNQKQEKK